jgi:hypothetical protein
MHSTCLRALSALAVGLGLSLGSTTGFAQSFEGEDAGFPAPEGDASVLPADSKLMRLFDGGCVLTEGVAAGHDGMMYFPTSPSQQIMPRPYCTPLTCLPHPHRGVIFEPI